MVVSLKTCLYLTGYRHVFLICLKSIRLTRKSKYNRMILYIQNTQNNLFRRIYCKMCDLIDKKGGEKDEKIQ